MAYATRIRHVVTTPIISALRSSCNTYIVTLFKTLRYLHLVRINLHSTNGRHIQLTLVLFNIFHPNTTGEVMATVSRSRKWSSSSSICFCTLQSLVLPPETIQGTGNVDYSWNITWGRHYGRAFHNSFEARDRLTKSCVLYQRTTGITCHHELFRD